MLRISTSEAPEIMYVAKEIHSRIPNELTNNIVVEGSSLGGAVIISFWSNLHKNITYTENSKHFFKIIIHFTNGRNERTQGVTIEMWQRYGILKHLRGNKQEIEIKKAVEKIVKYINDNAKEFYMYAVAEV